jgi:hypothetical protein
MDFHNLVLSILNESPDNILYQDKWYGFDEADYTFFILNPSDKKEGAAVVIRPDVKQGYNEDLISPLGPCIVYAPTKLPADKVEEIYLEDPANKVFTHWNLASLLNYNEVYDYETLKSFGIRVHSFKTDADSYFQKFKQKNPRMAFALEGDEESIGLKYRGRIWKIDGKIVVSLWEFNKEIAETFVIPFIKQTFGVSDDDIEVEISQGEDPGSFVSGSKISGASDEIKPYEKEINQLLAKLHTTTGPDKQKVREQLKQLLLKHNLEPAKYGISDEILKGSQVTAQKVLGKSEEPMASFKSRMQTSESVSY